MDHPLSPNAAAAAAAAPSLIKVGSRFGCSSSEVLAPLLSSPLSLPSLPFWHVHESKLTKKRMLNFLNNSSDLARVACKGPFTYDVCKNLGF